MEMEFVDLPSDSSVSDVEDFEEDFELDFIDVYDGYISDIEEIQPRFGGYEYEFVDEVSPNQKCAVCLLPMRDAVQTSDCGHRFCRDCLHGILRSGHPVCPNDRTEIKEEGGFFSDKAWARDILSLRVKCQQNARGCDWIGELRHAEEHQDDCPYEDTQCSSCQDNVQRRLKETHLNEECPKRIVECGHCHDEFFFVQKQEHEEMYCKRFPLVCENNCGHEEIPREEMARHVSEKCPMTIVSCGYASAGCPFQDKRAHLNDHMEASVDDHLEMTWSSLVQAKEELDNMRHKFHEQQEVNQKMADEVQEVNQKMADVVQEVNQKMGKSFEDCRAEIRNLSLAVKNIELENIGQKKMMEDMARKAGKELKSVESKVLRYVQGRVPNCDSPIPPEIKQSPDDIRSRYGEAPNAVPQPRGIRPYKKVVQSVCDKGEVISKWGKISPCSFD